MHVHVYKLKKKKQTKKNKPKNNLYSININILKWYNFPDVQWYNKYTCQILLISLQIANKKVCYFPLLVILYLYITVGDAFSKYMKKYHHYRYKRTKGKPLYTVCNLAYT